MRRGVSLATVIVGVLALAVLGLSIIATLTIDRTADENLGAAQAQKISLAQQVAEACATGELTGPICGEAAETIQSPSPEAPRVIVIQGRPGPSGAVGPAGRDGINGRDGNPGQDGATGADGRDGAPGPAGEPGPAGPPGSEGPPGPEGPQGPAGPPATGEPEPDPEPPVDEDPPENEDQGLVGSLVSAL